MFSTAALTTTAAIVALTAAPGATAPTPMPFTRATWGAGCIEHTQPNQDPITLIIDDERWEPGTVNPSAEWRFKSPSSGRATFVLTDTKGRRVGPSAGLTFTNVRRVSTHPAAFPLPAGKSCNGIRVRVTVTATTKGITRTHQMYVTPGRSTTYIGDNTAR